MQKSKKPIHGNPVSKKNMTLKEASEYWDKHSFFDFDDIEEVAFDIELIGSRHFILLDNDVAKKLKIYSRRKRRPEHSLANLLLKRSLQKVT